MNLKNSSQNNKNSKKPNHKNNKIINPVKKQSKAIIIVKRRNVNGQQIYIAPSAAIGEPQIKQQCNLTSDRIAIIQKTEIKQRRRKM